MGKLITVVGNSGVGKTTLTKNLCEVGSFIPLLETIEVRPFIPKFQDNRKRFSLPNQIDFLLFQAEQEILVRENDNVGVLDGGLDQSFHVFTKRFHQKGDLEDDEFFLCERLYSTLRRFLPLPDLIIELTAPYSILAERMAKRQRDLDIEKSEDLFELGKLFEEWLTTVTSIPIIRIDASGHDPSYSTIIDDLIRDINNKLGIN